MLKILAPKQVSYCTGKKESLYKGYKVKISKHYKAGTMKQKLVIYLLLVLKNQPKETKKTVIILNAGFNLQVQKSEVKGVRISIRVHMTKPSLTPAAYLPTRPINKWCRNFKENCFKQLLLLIIDLDTGG